MLASLTSFIFHLSALAISGLLVVLFIGLCFPRFLPTLPWRKHGKSLMTGGKILIDWGLVWIFFFCVAAVTAPEEVPTASGQNNLALTPIEEIPLQNSIDQPSSGEDSVSEIQKDQNSFASSEDGTEFIQTHFYELLEFKDDSEFRELGFGQGGPYYQWLERVRYQHGKENYSVEQNTALADLMALGLEYVGTEGQENDATRYHKEQILYVLADASETSLNVVASISDSDTLSVDRNGSEIAIRLGCIDAPENDQSGGDLAKQRLSQLLPVGQAITVRAIEQDQYGREIAEIYVDGQSVNLQMVAEGHAVVYDQYLEGCSGTETQFLEAEQQAANAGLNFWAESEPIMPWAWRRGERPAPPIPPDPEPVVNLPVCVNSDCDCSDFSTQRQAQQVLEAFAGDPHRLDRDKDGIACESLR